MPTTPVRRIPHTTSNMSFSTRELIYFMQDMQPNDYASYDDLMKLTGIDSHERLLRLLSTARDYLRETRKQEFDLERGKGIVCLTETGKLGLMRRRRQEIHTRATKTVKIGLGVDMTKLTETQKYFYLAEFSTSSLVSLTTQDERVQQLEQDRTPRPYLLDPTTLDPTVFQGL